MPCCAGADGCSLLISGSRDELRSKAGWAGPAAGRQQLLAGLERLADPQLLLAGGRLAGLVATALEYRHSQAPAGAYPLLADPPPGGPPPAFEAQRRLELGGEVYHVALAPDGRLLAAGSSDGRIHIVDLDPAAGPPDDHLLTASSIRVEDLAAGTPRCRPEGHADAVTKLAFSPDSRRLLSCSKDARAAVWDAQSGALLCQFPHHTWPVRACGWLGTDSELALTASEDAHVVLWKSATATIVQVLAVRAADLVTLPSRLHVGMAVGRAVQLWELAGSLRLAWTAPLDEAPASVGRSEDGALLTADTKHYTYLLDAGSGRVVSRLLTPGHPKRHVYRSCLAGNLLARGAAQEVHVWNRLTGSLVAILEGAALATTMCWAPGGARLITGCDQGRLTFWGRGGDAGGQGIDGGGRRADARDRGAD